MKTCTRTDLAILLLALLGAARIGAAEVPVLRFYTWPEYIDTGAVADFEKEYGARVRYFYFNSDSERDRRLADSEGRGFDVVTLNGPVIETYRKLGWLRKLDSARMPDLNNADSRWRNAYPAARDYAVPYMLGTLGIAYRRDLVPEGVDSWLDLFRPVPKLCKRIFMGGDARELINMALKAGGARSSSTNPDDYRRAESLLLAQKPCVLQYAYPTIDDQSPLLRGTVAAAMTFSSDAATLKKVDARIEYVIPREGGGLWVDYQGILAGTPNPDLAMKFLNFLHRPAVNARIAESTGAMSTNPAGMRLLPASVRANSIVFPDAATLARTEEDKGSPPDISRIRNAIFLKVMR